MFNVKYASYFFYELTFFSAYLSLFTGQTGSTVPSEFDCERYSQSAARNVPHQSLHTSRDVRAPRRFQRRQKHLDETRSADSEQVRVDSQFFAPSQCTTKISPHKQHHTLHHFICVFLLCSCPSREDFPLIETEDKALLRRLRGLYQKSVVKPP